MTALPPANNFTDPTVTEGGFRSALTSLLSYLSGLFGGDGTAATARAALGLGNAATANQGAGNGLDADTLDGIHASAFATTAALNAHATATNNPHAVTAAQVGALARLNNIANAGGNIDIVGGSNVTVTSDAMAKQIFIAAGAVGETNLGANVGTGPGGFFRDKTGATLNFRTLKLGPNAVAAGWSITVSGSDVIFEIPPPPPPPPDSGGGPA